MSDTNHDSSIHRIELNLSYLVRWLEANHRRRNYPLERAHYLILRLLTQESPQSSGILAVQLGLDSSTVTRQLKAMMEQQLIDRLPDPSDRRGCLINATALGQEKFEIMKKQRCANTEKIFSDWDDEEKVSLADLLTKLNKSISDNLDGN
ncbi:MarR family winged helix-turn-helix transcriptional regulator [Celerinatantimonas sp. YJH-8]|uniref:MarR family winged helix-turn-helix transcriptional regulator n=1 Tax=Celerinatantimonas sp. YJH-8 TaxID=3228714 RepID=UPI0038C8A5C6